LTRNKPGIKGNARIKNMSKHDGIRNIPGPPDYRLIALDLDGTLLNSEKQLTEENARALADAAAQGIWIVPTTGRFFDGMPQVIRELPSSSSNRRKDCIPRRKSMVCSSMLVRIECNQTKFKRKQMSKCVEI